MHVVAAGAFKVKRLAIMDEVQAKHQSVTITKNGIPVARLVPIEEEQDSIFGFYADKMEILGDIESPIIPAGDWKRLK